MKKIVYLAIILLSLASIGISQTLYDSLFNSVTFTSVDNSEILLNQFKGKVVYLISERIGVDRVL